MYILDKVGPLGHKRNNMKLYTEEQVKKAISIAEYGDYECEQIIDELTPIELPSDEEVENIVKEFKLITYRNGFRECAKWMKDQILNQDK